MFRGTSVAISILAAHALPLCRAGTDVPDDDFKWATIGAPGNPAVDVPWTSPIDGRGRVDYEYRLAVTEVTVAQWYEFVLAYAPFVAPSEAPSISFTSGFIIPLGSPPEYVMIEEAANMAANMSWRMAARYCNWLHNGKQRTRQAFETGVYDTSTFTQNPDGTLNDQTTHSPGARYWIPSLDEWLKGMYYDASVGEQGTWWMQPAGSDASLIPGPPWKGGTTSASTWMVPVPPFVPEVDLYPTIRSPWGLLNGSGGMTEWTESWTGPISIKRFIKGSSYESDIIVFDNEDGLYAWQGLGPQVTFFQGLRLASATPNPGVLLPLDRSPVHPAKLKEKR